MNENIDDSIDSFAEFIKEKRTALGMSLADLSEKVFNDRENNYICSIESGRRKGISLKTMRKILSALNTEISYKEN